MCLTCDEDGEDVSKLLLLFLQEDVSISPELQSLSKIRDPAGDQRRLTGSSVIN